MNSLLHKVYIIIKTKKIKSFITAGAPALIILIFTAIIYGDVATSFVVKLSKSRVTASSKLIEKGLPDNFYSPEKAVDGDIKTSWCANAKGDAIVGQSITMEFEPTAAQGFSFFPGVGASGQWFIANNRITKAKITVTDRAGSVREFLTREGEGYCYDPRDPANENLSNEKRPCGLDTYSNTGTGVSFDGYICAKKVTITILAVKRGQKYDDTCISEAGLIVPGGPDGTPKEFTEFEKTCR